MKRWFYTVLCNFIYQHPRLYNAINNFLFWGRDRWWREIAASKVPKEKRVLELGCGMFPALEGGTIIDASSAMISRVAKRKGREKICASALTLPFKNQSFDFALSVFPPGIAADNGFFQERKFWQELGRIFDEDGVYVAAIYVKYNNWLDKLSSGILDPLPKDFWEKLSAIAPGFEIKEERQIDPMKNQVVLAIAKKKN